MSDGREGKNKKSGAAVTGFLRGPGLYNYKDIMVLIPVQKICHLLSRYFYYKHAVCQVQKKPVIFLQQLGIKRLWRGIEQRGDCSSGQILPG